MYPAGQPGPEVLFGTAMLTCWDNSDASGEVDFNEFKSVLSENIKSSGIRACHAVAQRQC